MMPASFPVWLAGISLLALLAYGRAATVPESAPVGLRLYLLLGWVLHAAAIVIDTSGVGSGIEGARFGFAPVFSVTLWLVITVYVVESRFLPIQGVRRALSMLGALAVLLALAFPGQLRPHAGSPWAPIHWVLGIASYGLFGAAVLHAAMMNRADRQMRQALQASRIAMAAGPSTVPADGSPVGLPLMRLERLTFRFVLAGFVVLSLAIALGWVFAHPWRWDHKVVFSVLGWLVYAGLLAGRLRFGWRGPQAARWVYVGAALLLLAYVGSHFVFEVLLHRLPEVP